MGIIGDRNVSATPDQKDPVFRHLFNVASPWVDDGVSGCFAHPVGHRAKGKEKTGKLKDAKDEEEKDADDHGELDQGLAPIRTIFRF
jgi:hypothetical protein